MEVVLNESNSQPMKQILSNISDDFNSLYEITEEIGRGGFSVVYKCKNKINNQIYAVKAIDLRPLRLRENFNPKRLKREVDIMKGMNHPNIIQFVHVYENDNQLLVVMEYAPGKELFDVILEKSKFTEEEAKPIFYQIASALSYMHSMGVIHRDIKPENILVLHDPDPITGIPIIKILDFGLSKHTGGGSLAKTFVGTPCYLAPEVEQASLNNGSSYDTPADCWSLGAVLYVMLVAHFPEFDRNVGRVGRIVLRLPQHLWKDISSEAKNLVQGLLCYEIDVRLTAADAMKHQWIGNYSNVVHQTKNYQTAYAPPSKKTQQSNKKVYDLVTKNQDSSNRRYFEIPPISIPSHIHNIPPIPPQSAFQQYSKPPQVDNTIPSEYLQSSPTNMITSTQYNPNMLNSYGHPGDIIYGSMVENNSDVCFRIVPLITLQREAIKCFQNAEKTYANRPDVATHIRTASLRCRQQIQDSLNMLRKIEQTSLAALNIIPDMEYALEVGEPQLIGDFLGTIKTWVAELINLVVNTQKSNEETIQNLHKAVNISDHLQLTSKNLLAASDPLIIDSNMVVNEIRRVVGELQERRKNQGLTDQDILELFSNLFGQENWKERGVIYSVSPSSSSHGKKHHRSQGSPTSSSDVEETIIGGSPAIISTIDNQNNQRVDIKRMDDMISALTVLREVDEILAHLSIFWSNTDVILDALSKKGQHIEKFITYTSNPNLVIRFRERILEYRRFWEKVNSMCTAYLLGMENSDSLSRVVTPPEEVFSSPQSSVSQ